MMSHKETEAAPLEVFETLLFDPAEGFVRLNLHLQRLKHSCACFGLTCDIDDIAKTLRAKSPATPARVRIAIKDTRERPEIAFFDAPHPAHVWRVAVHAQRVDEAQIWRRHKTNRRALYDNARTSLPPHLDEWLFLNKQDKLCEGTITSIFLKKEHTLLTPPIFAGALPSVLRQDLVISGKAEPRALTLNDITDTDSNLYVGNSLRGLIKAKLVDA